jgi:hypothetical protein
MNRAQWLAVALAGVVAALVGLICLLIAASNLNIADTSRFLIFWSLLYLSIGVIGGITAELTRSVAAARAGWASGNVDHLSVSSAPDASSNPARSPLTNSALTLVPVMLVLFTVLALAGGSGLPLWRHALPAFTGDDQWGVAIAIFVGVIGYTGQAVIAGGLAGSKQWRFYAILLATEAAARLLMVAVAALLRLGLWGMIWGCAAAEFVWVVFWLTSRRVRRALGAPLDAGGWVLLRRCLGAMFSQGVNSVLVIGFPWLLGLTTKTNVLLTAAPLMLAITLTRAPIMVPLAAAYNVGVNFLAHRRPHWRPLVVIIGIIAGIGVILAILVGLFGQGLLNLVHPSYGLNPWLLIGLVGAATTIAILTFTSIAAQARGLYGWLLGGWLVAIVAAVLLLLLPVSLETRALLALLIGPILGAVTHLGRLLTGEKLNDAHDPTAANDDPTIAELPAG